MAETPPENQEPLYEPDVVPARFLETPFDELPRGIQRRVLKVAEFESPAAE